MQQYGFQRFKDITGVLMRGSGEANCPVERTLIAIEVPAFLMDSRGSGHPRPAHA